jgi:hypothetical protein
MTIDATNPVVALCAQGMHAEAAGNPAEARDAFARAWDASRDAYERCIAARYVARHQPTPHETRRWNAIALSHAEEVADDRVAELLPSLHLNMGHSCETTGDVEGARRHYESAEAWLDRLPAGPYAQMVRRGVGEALRRIHSDRDT